MRSLNERLQAIGENFGSVLKRSFHYHKPDRVPPPYAVWQEDGEPDSIYTDDMKSEQSIEGSLDLYTTKEFDPLVDAFQDILNEKMHRWHLNSVTYEDDTKLIHYSWEWTEA